MPTSRAVTAVLVLVPLWVLVACGDDGAGPDVNPEFCQEPLDLAPGESVALTPPPTGECGAILPSGAAGDRYRVGLIWTSHQGRSDDVDVTLQIEGHGVSASSTSFQPAPAPSFARDFVLDDPELRRELEESRERGEAHREMLERSQALLRRMGPDALLPDGDDDSGHLTAGPEPAPQQRTFHAPAASCDTTKGTVDAELLAENEFLAIYQDTASTAQVTSTATTMLMDYYRDHGAGVIQDYFGGISDIDANGKFLILLTQLDQDVDAPLAAIVLGRDFVDSTSCEASNEGEITYFSPGPVEALDPPSGDVNFQALATLVHEVKHISSLYNRAQAAGGTGDFHPSWIEEGTAEIAGEMSSRRAWDAAGGPSSSALIDRQAFVDEGGFTPENWGVILRMGRTTVALSSQPNAVTANPSSAADHDFYGSSWHFFRFIGDVYGGGPENDAGFFRKQNAPSSPGGMEFIENELGKSFQTLAQEYILATMVNETAVESQASRAFKSYGFASATSIFCVPNPLGIYPWPVTTTGEQAQGDCAEGHDPSEEQFDPTVDFGTRTVQGPIGRGGMRVHDLVSDGTGDGAEIHVDAQVPDPEGEPLRMVVVRLN